MTDNNKFWKRVSPLFSNKIKTKEKITLVENSEIVSIDSEVASIFNEFFTTIVKNLNIYRNPDHLLETRKQDRVLASIEKFSKHPSILNIEKKMSEAESSLSFQFVEQDSVVKEIQILKSNKTSQQNDIPIKNLKENIDICSYILYHNFNNSLSSAVFSKRS